MPDIRRTRMVGSKRIVTAPFGALESPHCVLVHHADEGVVGGFLITGKVATTFSDFVDDRGVVNVLRACFFQYFLRVVEYDFGSFVGSG